MRILAFILLFSITTHAAVIRDDNLYIGARGSTAPKFLKMGPNHIIRTREGNTGGSLSDNVGAGVSAGLDFSSDGGATWSDLTDTATGLENLRARVNANTAAIGTNTSEVNFLALGQMSVLGTLVFRPIEDCVYTAAIVGENAWVDLTPDAACTYGGMPTPDATAENTTSNIITNDAGVSSVVNVFRYRFNFVNDNAVRYRSDTIPGFTYAEDDGLPDGRYLIRFQGKLRAEDSRPTPRNTFFSSLEMRIVAQRRVGSSTDQTVRVGVNTCVYDVSNFVVFTCDLYYDTSAHTTTHGGDSASSGSEVDFSVQFRSGAQNPGTGNAVGSSDSKFILDAGEGGMVFIIHRLGVTDE